MSVFEDKLIFLTAEDVSADSNTVPLCVGFSETTVGRAFSLSTETSRELLGDFELSLL